MRYLMWFSVGFVTASLLCAYWYQPWFLFLLLLTLPISSIFLLFKRKFRGLRVGILVLVGFSAGLGWFYGFDRLKLEDLRKLDGTTQVLPFGVEEFPEQTTYGSSIRGSLSYHGQSYVVRVYLNDIPEVVPGDSLYGNFRLRFTALGAKEEPTYHRGSGIYLLAYQRGDYTITHSPKNSPEIWRRQMLQKLEAYFEPDTVGFAKSILLGDTESLDYETDTALRVSGIRHVVAVSGLHISILLGIVYFFTLRRPWLSFLLGIFVMGTFAAVVGFTPSVTRACLMMSLMLLATVRQQGYDPPTALGVAALIMTLHNPMVVISISFQLSFASVAGILLFAGPIANYLFSITASHRKKKRLRLLVRLKSAIIYGIGTSLGSLLFTAPLIAYYFQTVSLVGVLTNLLVLWLVPFVFYGALGVALLPASLAFVSRFLALGTGAVIRLCLGIAKLLANIPLAAVYTQNPYIVLWLVAAYGLLAVFLLSRTKRSALMLVVTGASLCLAVVLGWLEPRADTFRMTMLDVGQGQSILLQQDGKHFLVDCGGNTPEDAADVAAQTLLSQGIGRLDGVIVTHYDADHAGGVPYLLSRIPADVVFLPENGSDGEEAAQILKSTDWVQFVGDLTELSFDNAKLSLMGSHLTRSANDSGLCILLESPEASVLITGDRSELGEFVLLKQFSLPKVDVLVAGHHGSAGSTGEDLLQKVQPEYVFISAGEGNSYGLPSDALLERLEKNNCQIYRTDQHGMILFRR